MRKVIMGVFVIAAAFLMLSVRPVAAEFDEYGYNDQARIFNGTGLSWCAARGWDEAACADAIGADYVNDKLVMKWTADWDRGNDENWANGPYDKAWENNEWNGNVEGGSGSVWHYKIHWVGDCTDSGTPSDEGYCIWGQFEVLMDQGTADGVHVWLTHATPTGYGALDWIE